MAQGQKQERVMRRFCYDNFLSNWKSRTDSEKKTEKKTMFEILALIWTGTLATNVDGK